MIAGFTAIALMFSVQERSLQDATPNEAAPAAAKPRGK